MCLTSHCNNKTNSKVYSPSGMVNYYSESQETFRLFTEPRSSLMCSLQPITGPYLDPHDSNPHLPVLFVKDPC